MRGLIRAGRMQLRKCFICMLGGLLIGVANKKL